MKLYKSINAQCNLIIRADTILALILSALSTLFQISQNSANNGHVTVNSGPKVGNVTFKC